MHVVVQKMRKKYGKVFSLYLGNEPFVIVADFDLYKEAMAREELLYRPGLGVIDEFFFPDEKGKVNVSVALLNQWIGTISEAFIIL